MADASERYEGGCHCGNLTVVLEATKPLEDLALRICGCSYCRRQDGLYVSDAAGRICFGLNTTLPKNNYQKDRLYDIMGSTLHRKGYILVKETK